MFYTIFDVICYYASLKETDIKSVIRWFNERGIDAAIIEKFKQEGVGHVSKEAVNVALEFCGISYVSLSLLLGRIPEGYRVDFLNKINDIGALLQKKEITNVENESKCVLETKLGKLFNDDCLSVLKNIGDGTVDCVFADPPFNLNKEYHNGFVDRQGVSAYLNWSYRWLDECIRILRPGGSLLVYNIPKWCSYYSVYLNFNLEFRNWIAIDMKTGFPGNKNYNPSHYGLLYYIKPGGSVVFNKIRIPVLTCRHCGGEIRDYGGHKDKINRQGLNISDVWTDIYPVRSGKNRKSNELSVKFIERIVSTHTNEGDLIVDPFSGSGTVCAVSELLERRWYGIEIGDCEGIVKRIANNENDKKLLYKSTKDKNKLFTDDAIRLRKKNGFWL